MIPRNLRQQRAAKAQKSRSVVKTLPAPTGGWNARDAISDMPPTDAVALVNFFPETTDVILRYGDELQATLSGTSSAANAMQLDGVSGYATTPDAAVLDVASDIDMRAYVALDDWTTATAQFLISKGTPLVIANYSYQLYIVNGLLTIEAGLSTGIGAIYASSIVIPGAVDGSPLWVRATFVLVSGANSVGTFYTSTNGTTWTQFGTTSLGAARAGTINNTTFPVEIGRGIWDGTSLTYFTGGKIYQALIYSGVAGTKVAHFNAADGTIGGTSLTSSQTGEIYTLTGAASLIYDATIATGSAPASNQVETLMAYSGGSTNKLFAILGGQIWNVTTQNAASLFSSVSLGGSRWNYVNIATSGGNYLYMVNQQGLDSPYTYDGTNWSQPSITGVTTTELCNINSHKNRIWFIERNTLKAWYLPTASIAGAVNALDLSAFFPRGGKLIAMATWTIDAGYGVDDMAVFLTDKGEAAVYRGTDPSSSTTWALVGVYWMGAPIGNRPYVKYAGDCLVITLDGIVPLSGALQSSRTNPRVAISDKIQDAISLATVLYQNNFGWQVIPFPKQSMLIVNVPVSEGVTQEQYIMNTITGAWCRFTGWNANCWELFNDNLYFGGTNKTVMKAWSGANDNSTAIEGAALQAFNYFGSSGQQKRFPMMRPVLLATGAVPLSARMNIDFDQNIVNSDFSNTAPVSGATWDSAVWDVDLWQNDFVQSTGWRGAAGVGFCAAPEIGISSASIHAKWVATDVVVEPGAII